MRRRSKTPAHWGTGKHYDKTIQMAAMYRRRRLALIAELGGECACEGCIVHPGHCGATEQLEFDHPFGRDWVAREKSRWTRIALYERDYKAGNLRLLCKACNLHYVPVPF